MFTGLVEEIGRCSSLTRLETGAELVLACKTVTSDIARGDSLAVNGCCLTVTTKKENTLSFDLLGETLDRTNLGTLQPGHEVNLERSLPANGRLGGHYVQGHVDYVARLASATRRGEDLRMEFMLPQEFAQYVAFKGSLAVNGVSLTVAEVASRSFVVWIIPHTQSSSILGKMVPGDSANIECDILAKYTERILQASALEKPKHR